jgi:radical SAM protein with 4Fe4S-binding SPASM domain
MVTLWNTVKDDIRSLVLRMGSTAPEPGSSAPTPGFYTYRFQPPYQGAAGQVRIHLRIESDGRGLLFVDVTEVVHLNSTAAMIAKWALDGVPRASAESMLVAQFGRSQRRRQLDDLSAMYAMIERFARPGNGCPTCSIDGLRQADIFSTPPAAPYKADLAITYECNNDCPHCYNEADRLTLNSMEVEEWKRVVDRLAQVGVPHLILTGGEATLYPDLPELVAHADARGPIVGLNSNGRRFAHRLYASEMAAAGLNHLQVTLGSHEADVHDRMMNARCFKQTIRGIRHAIDAGIHTITNTTLMQMNKDRIEDTISFLHDLGIRTFAVNGMIYSGGGFDTGQAIPEEEMPASLIRIRDKALELNMRFLWYTPTQYCRLSPVELEIGAKRCNAGEYSICVEPNGDVLPCQSYYVAAGNILRDPWERIWTSDLFVSFRDRELDPQGHGLPEKCWECPDLPLCGGGCRIEREAADGVRVADGGGCAGCAGGCGSDGNAVGFVALEELTPDKSRRGTGAFAPGQHEAEGRR